jgi:hypothetical protein
VEELSAPEGVVWKVRRAAEHAAAVEAAVYGFLHGTPSPFQITTRDHLETRERSWWLELLEEPPTVEWAGLAGEVLHNLRSALDHLAWALCVTHLPGETPPERTEFPIFHGPDAFDNPERGGGLWKIRGMSAEMKAAIRREQPFSISPSAPKNQSLWLLQEMSNIDKHRNLNLVTVPPEWTAYAAFEDPNVEMRLVLSPEGEIARARPLTPDAEIRIEPIFFPQVVFDEAAGPGRHRPADVQLKTFVQITNEIVGRLSEQFLSDQR